MIHLRSYFKHTVVFGDILHEYPGEKPYISRHSLYTKVGAVGNEISAVSGNLCAFAICTPSLGMTKETEIAKW